MMGKLTAMLLLALGMASLAHAQGLAAGQPDATANNAVDFARASGVRPNASASAAPPGDFVIASLAPPETSLAALSFAAPPSPSPNAAPVPADPSPAPQVNYTYKERDYAWDLGIGFSLVRFRSSIYYASAPGFNSNLAYWWKNWVALEASFTTGFAPVIFQNEHVKFLGYGAGPKISLTGRSRLEPWVHAIIGGAHVLPKTASNSTNSFLFEAGAGVDYGLAPRISARLELDYLGTHFFGQWQHSAQGVLGVILHF